ncbi:MAG: hypothetical protein OEZ06_05495 [Myxococcales bacterium]|nr:hypothetical protein [Myxococcales bacterium]
MSSYMLNLGMESAKCGHRHAYLQIPFSDAWPTLKVAFVGSRSPGRLDGVIDSYDRMSAP